MHHQSNFYFVNVAKPIGKFPLGNGNVSGAKVSVMVPSLATFITCSDELVGEFEIAYRNCPVGSNLMTVTELPVVVVDKVRCCNWTGNKGFVKS